MPLPSTTSEKSIIDQLLRRSKLTSTAVSIINRLLQRTIVETIGATTALTLKDSGKFFLLDSTSAVTVTLPVLSSELIGTTYTFVVKTANDNSYLIQTGDLTNGTGDTFTGYAMLGANQVSNTTNGANGRMRTATGNTSGINLDANATNGGGEIGSTVKLTAISSTKWFCEVMVFTVEGKAGAGAGGGIFSNES